MKDIVCIIGANEITRGYVDWGLPNADYWVFNEMAYTAEADPNRWNYGKPVTGAFQMHVPEIWRSDNGGHFEGYYEWLQRPHDFPIYMQDHYADVPSSVRYPFDEIVAEFLSGFRNDKEEIIKVFTSSMEYMVALAIYQGRKEIRFYGVEAASGTEYERQRAGISFWIGLALGKGIKIIRHSRSMLLNSKLYGYTGEVMITRQRFEIASAQLEREVIKTRTEMFEAQGRVKATLDALMATKSQKDAERLQKEFLKALNEAQDKVFENGLLSGRFGENKLYLKECDELIEAAGGVKAQAVLENVPA